MNILQTNKSFANGENLKIMNRVQRKLNLVQNEINSLQKYEQELISQLRDNAVPSFDIDSFLEYKPFYKQYLNPVSRLNIVNELIKDIREYQNGVENPKERPKLQNKCTGHNDKLCNVCINYCTVTGDDSEF